MREAELRAELQKRRAVPDETWRYLVDLGFVESAEHEEGQAAGRPLDYLAEAYDKIAAAAPLRGRGQKPIGRVTTEERPKWQLKDEELERSWAFSEHVSKIASADGEVRRFRSRYLGGGTVIPRRALALLTSPAAAIWPSLEFHWSGFSVLGHTHRIVEKGRDERGAFSQVEAYDPAADITKRLTDRRPLAAGPWSVPREAEDALSNSGEREEINGWELLSFLDEEHDVNRVCVRAGSVLGDLRARTRRLIRRYPWQESEAVWFILTGETPWVAPVSFQGRGVGSETTGLFGRQFVTIKAEPWISEETVRRTYREAQVRMLQGDNRPAKDKQLALFRFVSSRTDPFTLYGKERARAAKELVSVWDRTNPHDAYGTDTRRFWRDYDRALELIAMPRASAKRREKERRARERRRQNR